MNWRALSWWYCLKCPYLAYHFGVWKWVGCTCDLILATQQEMHLYSPPHFLTTFAAYFQVPHHCENFWSSPARRTIVFQCLDMVRLIELTGLPCLAQFTSHIYYFLAFSLNLYLIIPTRISPRFQSSSSGCKGWKSWEWTSGRLQLVL